MEKQSYAVSIIIPIYNVEQYLRESLDSVIGQTLKDIEIVCVNDGSTDSSLDIIKEYAAADSRLKVIDKANSGYGDSMNKGMDVATGEYIGIVEPDDKVDIQMFEVLYGKARSLDLDFIKSDFIEFHGKGNKLEQKYRCAYLEKIYYNRVVNPQEDAGLFDLQMNTWTGIYKREFLERFNIKHNTSPGASYQDNGFWFQTFMHASRIMVLDRAFYFYRQDNPNSSINNKEKIFAMADEYDYIYTKVAELKEDRVRFRRMTEIFHYKRFHNYLYNLHRIAKKHKPLFMERFKEDYLQAHRDGTLNWDMFVDGQDRLLRLIMGSKKKRDLGNTFCENIFSIKRNRFTRRKMCTIFWITFEL